MEVGRSIGRAYDMQLSDAEASKKGKEIKDAYIDAIPGLGKFLDDVKRAADRGYIKLIDGRKISVDSGHKVVNYLQNCRGLPELSQRGGWSSQITSHTHMQASLGLFMMNCSMRLFQNM